MNGYSGRIIFVKWTKYGTIQCITERQRAHYEEDPEYVVVGESDPISVLFCDSRQKEIEGLQKQIENERAESQQRLNVMMGRIQELQAISHD